MAKDPGTPTLLTFAPMIDSELSRFVLTHYGIAYREAPHLFGWGSILALFHGNPQVPLLYGTGPSLAGPRAIVDHFDPLVPTDRRLIPTDGFLATEVTADWDRFNGIFGTATAVFCYYHLLPHRAIMIEPFSRGGPRAEATALKVVYPALAGLFRLLLQLDTANAADALTQIRCLFDETDKRLADGRQFLVGDRLTLSDLAFAAAAAPLLLPANFGSPVPPLEAMPPELQAVVAELRARPAAGYVERIYARYRQGGG